MTHVRMTDGLTMQRAFSTSMCVIYRRGRKYTAASRHLESTTTTKNERGDLPAVEDPGTEAGEKKV